MTDSNYAHMLDQEAALWGRVAEEQAASVPPDWRYHRALRHNVIMHTADIEALLGRVTPGMRALEIGCGAGWLTLALAQRGAHAHGLDISSKAIAIARTYHESIQDAVSGRATYDVADLNAIQLPPEQYDLVVAKGVLHHLVNMDRVIEQLHRTLKPGGLLWVHDTHGDEAPATVLIASGLMFVLPTEIAYRDKIKGLLSFGVRAPQRIRASMQADGLSPFEGAGRAHDWLALVKQHFTIEQRHDKPAFTGYITAQLKLPDRLAIPLLVLLRAVDTWLVRLHVLRSSGVILYARKDRA